MRTCACAARSRGERPAQQRVRRRPAARAGAHVLVAAAAAVGAERRVEGRVDARHQQRVAVGVGLLDPGGSNRVPQQRGDRASLVLPMSTARCGGEGRPEPRLLPRPKPPCPQNPPTQPKHTQPPQPKRPPHQKNMLRSGSFANLSAAARWLGIWGPAGSEERTVDNQACSRAVRGQAPPQMPFGPRRRSRHRYHHLPPAPPPPPHLRECGLVREYDGVVLRLALHAARVGALRPHQVEEAVLRLGCVLWWEGREGGA